MENDINYGKILEFLVGLYQRKFGNDMLVFVDDHKEFLGSGWFVYSLKHKKRFVSSIDFPRYQSSGNGIATTILNGTPQQNEKLAQKSLIDEIMKMGFVGISSWNELKLRLNLIGV